MSGDGFEILEKTSPHQGYFRVDRYVLRFRRFDGEWSPAISREIFERGHAVGLLLYDPVTDQVGLIEQFRPGALAAGWHPWLIELPAGIIDEGESPENVAIREAKEETGLDIGDPILIRRYLATPAAVRKACRSSPPASTPRNSRACMASRTRPKISASSRWPPKRPLNGSSPGASATP